MKISSLLKSAGISFGIIVIFITAIYGLNHALQHESETARFVQMIIGIIWIAAICGAAEYFLVIKGEAKKQAIRN